MTDPYFVQFQPGSSRLVPGVLIKGQPPTGEGWVAIHRILFPLAQRYFVKMAPDNQLVPGALISATHHPGKPWKELKPVVTPPSFIYLALEPIAEVLPNGGGEISFLEDFNSSVAFYIHQILPERSDLSIPFEYQLFVFKGSYHDLVLYNTQLTLVSATSSPLRIYAPSSPMRLLDTFYSDQTNPVQMHWKPFTPAGIYSVALGVLNSRHQIKDYLIMESLVIQQ